MQTHDLVQGSDAWHSYRAQHNNASDAPAMLGVSPYKSRSDLLQERATGITQEISRTTQALFDDGHRFEALARPLAEEIVGEDLYPVTGSLGTLSASFDGLTMAEDIAWEHKTLNDEIRAATTAQDLGIHYRVQMEQQLLVSGAEKCLFLASRWDHEGQLVDSKHFWYESDADLRQRIVSGWEQFAKDVADYQHIEILPAAIAAPVKDLPALSIRVDGSLNLNHNLVIFGDKLNAFIADINTKPEDDQGFADAEAAIKVMERAENALAGAEASALAQVSSVDDMVKTVAAYKELARKTRLMLEKMVKARKETIRIEIQQVGKDKAVEHIASLNTRLGKPYMPAVAFDFAGVMKGKKTVASLRDAVDTELARFKIEANAVADRIQINLGTLRELAVNHTFLFADAASIVLKAADDLTALVKLRIAEHNQAEADKAEKLRAKIAEEERVKAEAAAAETVRLAKVESDRVAAEAAAAARAAEKPAAVELAEAKANPAGADLSPAAQALNEKEGSKRFASVHRSIPASAPAAPPSLRLGQIAERLGFSLTADFMRELGFDAAGRDRAAVLYHDSDFDRICFALIEHIGKVRADHRITEAA
jgi:putative phage-type endonuclease